MWRDAPCKKHQSPKLTRLLTLCPTPIGNLDDVTPRQLAVLRGADIVACEDSRTTGKLFELLGIARPDGVPRFVPYHEHNEAERCAELLTALHDGQHVVLVSDAGTPALSDPGYRLVRAAREAQLDVEVLPGPFAAAMAVAGSGLPTDCFRFEGFAPNKQGARRLALARARDAQVTTVFYESPRRVGSFLRDVAEVFGSDHEVCVARELTKLHEEWTFGEVGTVADTFADGTRGELAVVIAPAKALARDDIDHWIAAMVDSDISPRTIKAVISSVTGLSKSEIFERLEKLKS